MLQRKMECVLTGGSLSRVRDNRDLSARYHAGRLDVPEYITV